MLINKDKYIPYISIDTINPIQVNTAQYLHIQLNVYRYVQYLVHTSLFIHISTYQYISIHAIHTTGKDTYQYIPSKSPLTTDTHTSLL